MKKIGIVLFCLIFMSFCAQKNKQDNKQEKTPDATTKIYNVELFTYYKAIDVMTVGDHSYIPLNLKGIPHMQVEKILKALRLFEDNHPNLETLSFSIEKRQRSRQTAPFIYGIWVSHRKK